MESPTHSCAFYAVADSRHFLGLVALLNSLRLVGHVESLFVSDQGLTADQRRRLADHATILEGTTPLTPHFAKTDVPRRHRAQVQVLIDVDIIVLRHLAPLIEDARAGKVVAFADKVKNRFHSEWSELLDLGALRKQTYVNTGLVAVGGPVGQRFLEDVDAAFRRIGLDPSLTVGAGSVTPFLYLDQDVMNAILAAGAPDLLTALDSALAPFPPFSGVQLVDARSLQCRGADGVEPYLLHHVRKKPWLARTRWSVYCLLMSRLLLGPDLTVRLRPEEVPVRFRPGPVARLDRGWGNLVATIADQRGRLGLRRALRSRRPRCTPTADANRD